MEKNPKSSDTVQRSSSARRPARIAVDEDGFLPFARYIESANCDDRPEDASITLVVIHAISLPPGEFGGQGIIDLFTNRLDPTAHPYYASIESLRVSAHFLIRRDGELLQFVPCEKRAWHAGASSWKGRERCNDFSIGIELEGADSIPYKAAQYHVLARVMKALYRRYRFRYVVGHSDIAPGRKTDPGPAFDWKRLERLLAKKKRR